MMAEKLPTGHALEIQILRSLVDPRNQPGEVVAASALGPAELLRFGRILTGRLGRDELIRSIDWARAVLDEKAATPARWRGPSRKSRELERSVGASWLGAAFGFASRFERHDALTLDDLVRFNKIVGGTGELRRGSISVDGYEVPFSPEHAVAITEAHLARVAATTDPVALAAAKLHFGILLAHPFRDGNGRTARAAAGAILLSDGMRSSLLTCVEQHFHAAPRRYRLVLGRYRDGAVGIDGVIDDLLGAMASRCLLAAWVRVRCRMVVQSFASAGPAAIESALAFDRGEPVHMEPPGDRPEPWHRLQHHLHPFVAAELKSQLSRAHGDRQSQGNSTDQQNAYSSR